MAPSMALPEPYDPSHGFAPHTDTPHPEPHAFDPHPTLAQAGDDTLKDEGSEPTWILSIDVGHKNLAMCAIEPGSDPTGREDLIRFWVVTSTLPGAYAVTDTMRGAGVAAILPRIKEVCIERQPGRNTPAVRLQNYLEMYFCMSSKFVALQDAVHKLSFAASSPWWPKKPPENWTYHTRKKVAIETTRAFLADTPQPLHALDTWKRSSKLDDLADSLLHGMAHVHYVAPLANSKAQAKRSKVPSARRPNAKQLASGKLAKSHVVFYVTQSPTTLDSLAQLNKACDEFKPLRRGLIKHFGSVEHAFAVLGEFRSRSGANAIDLGPPRRPPAPLPLGQPEAHADVHAGMQDRRVHWGDQPRPRPADHGAPHQRRA